jgi:4-amino-4-deoxy-L-arabinose transferase-like glycosyltransferase
VLAIIVLALACVAINPVGFIGGGGDDTHYLEAARCWVASGGPCLPANHWWTRWPVIAPIAGSIALFGESRASLGLGFVLYWVASIALTAWIAQRWFGRFPAFLAAALLIVTPVFTAAALQPNADIPELAFQLAAIAAATLAFETQRRGWAIGAGLLTGIAMAARDTSILFVAAAALSYLFLPRHRRGVLVWAVPGLLSVLLGEAVVYAITAGDPLWRYKLAAAHVTIPSDDLAGNVDTSKSPLFNSAYIAGWKPDMGIRIAWPIDPWLNLLASPKIALTLIAAGLLGALYWNRVPGPAQRPLLVLAGCALLIALLLVYGLAVDPKPRMFLALVATCALASGAFAEAALNSGQKLFPAFVYVGCALCGLYVLSIHPASYQAEARAQEWMKRHPSSIEIDDRARAFLTLLPEVRAVPAMGSGRALLITTAAQGCSLLRRPSSGPLSHMKLVDFRGGPNPAQPQLCLWAYPRAGS